MCDEIAKCNQSVMVCAASVRSSRDRFDADDACGVAAAVGEAHRYSSLGDGWLVAGKWVGLVGSLCAKVFAGVYHSNDEVMYIAYQLVVLTMPVPVPLGKVDGVVVDVSHALCSCFVSVAVALSFGGCADASFNVVVCRMPFDLAGIDGVRVLGNDTGKECQYQVTILLHVPWFAQMSRAIRFL